MERILPNDFVLSAEYETLGLIDDDDDESVSDDDYVNEEDDDGDDEVWDGDEVDSDDDYDISGIGDGHDFMVCYSRDAWDKLSRTHRNILLRFFTQRLPNLSEQEKNGSFHVFSQSEAFGVLEHNALLDALTHPVEGLVLVFSNMVNCETCFINTRKINTKVRDSARYT
ncbi:uncharacterized protein OCT59_001322 [Rhizophagus irregularis]|uniref:Uncharacterized protein n=2 Tax=Rhizophagus irregularis TaxID=588596 RepID=A0A015LSM3_RHIIW|nr:hypothetical protein GLOIN_2v1043511 [Rhizophagus irregularis DAOM 181602=DAOM 197198]EXX57658.1 hypothetical protein RirG_205140 [Rhizophagus irregularis DAOM 197198w]POG74452.1 hypothetical protein GLOIN_2v1043511 [Rhizophagus irregularis DAOM 181602=DAOM 197198]UZO00068.1 hypothetical protein OCT59_001322 [Rhizophagus irregularis]|eukprot:XP_025181318.1 hypothetical protein GLOIN_2v1043511 [Rhizophagus irregularis DAOM 181602=DAOM 197198]